MTVTLWLDTDAEETIDLGATLPFYQAWAEIVHAGGSSFADDYPDLAGVASQCEDQEDADPDWLQDMRLQAADALKEHGDSLSDRAQAILSLLAGDDGASGDNPLSPEAATFAEEDPFDFGDISFGGLSREEIAEILIDAALDARDDAEFAWEESKHPRGQPGNRGKFGPGGGAENPHESRDFAIDVHGELTERPNTPIFQHPVRKAIEDRIVHLLQAGKSRSKGEVSLTFRPVYGMTSVHQGDGIVAAVYYFPADGKVLVSQPLVGGRKQARFDEHTPPAELEYKLRKVLGLKVPPEVERQYTHINKAPRLADSEAEAAFDNAEFYDPNQLRDESGRWTAGGGGGASQGLPHVERQAQRESAKETVRRFMAGQGSPSLQEASGLAQALSTLTVAQIHEVKREHGLKASAPDKAGLVAKLAERFRAAREAKPAEAKPSEKKPAESKPSDLRREAVKAAIGDTYSKYNGTHQLLQDIAGKHDTLAGALSEAERQGLIDTRQRGPQTDVSPLQTDRQGEFVRRVLGQAYGIKAEPQPAQPAERLITPAMPPLEGSSKQVRWADEIRSRQIADLERWRDTYQFQAQDTSTGRSAESRNEDARLSQLYQAVLEWAAEQKDSRFWIDNRHENTRITYEREQELQRRQKLGDGPLRTLTAIRDKLGSWDAAASAFENTRGMGGRQIDRSTGIPELDAAIKDYGWHLVRQIIEQHELAEAEEGAPVRDRVPEGTYGPSKAALRFDSDQERQEVEEMSRQIFGKQATPQDLATVSGAPDGANVSFRVTTFPWAKTGHVSIEVEYHGYTNDGSYEGNRTIQYTPTGGARIENNLFRGKGSGLEMFGRQVEQATRFGIGHIETHAVGKFVPGPDPNKTYAEDNGYITWPKFGYNGPLEQSDIDRLPANLRADVETSGGNLSGLMASKEGQDWWLRNGSAINLRFDLTPGSYSQRTLAAYLEKRGILK